MLLMEEIDHDHTINALRTVLPVVGWAAEATDTVAFRGGTDPLLPTPFRIGTASAATVAAAGLAAARLWEQRTRRRQQESVDIRQATISLRSGHYMKLGDGELSAKRNDIMGVYPARNGRWSYLHRNFPNHRAAALKGNYRRQGSGSHGSNQQGVGRNTRRPLQ